MSLTPLEIAREEPRPAPDRSPAELEVAAALAHRRAGWATWLLGAFAAFSVLPLAAGLALGGLYADAAPERLDALAMILDRIEIVGRLITFAAAAVAFLAWKHAAYRLLPDLTGRDTDHTPGWAIGGYFVPFLNFVRPYRIMAELWDESEPDRKALALDDGSAGRWMLPAWWSLWLVGSLVGRVAQRTDLWSALLISVIAFAVAGALAALLVRAVDARQQTRAAEIIGGEGLFVGAPAFAVGAANLSADRATPPRF